MNIEIEGTRASDTAWREAHSISVAALREKTSQEIAWRAPDDSEAEQLARRLYANDLTLPDLAAKCAKLASLATDWLKKSGVHGEVLLVRLRCLRGLFDLHISQDGQVHRLEIREDVLDDLLQAGSREAAESLERLFAANFGRLAVSRAS